MMQPTAAGSAVLMAKGSPTDWKFHGTISSVRSATNGAKKRPNSRAGEALNGP